MSSSHRRTFPAYHPATLPSMIPNDARTSAPTSLRSPSRIDPRTPYPKYVPLPTVTPSHASAPLQQYHRSSGISPMIPVLEYDQRGYNVFTPPPTPPIVATAMVSDRVFTSQGTVVNDDIHLVKSSKSASIGELSSRYCPENNGPGDVPKPGMLGTAAVPQVPSKRKPSPSRSPPTAFELYPALLAPVQPYVCDIFWNVSLPKTNARLHSRDGRYSEPLSEKILSVSATKPSIGRMELILRPQRELYGDGKHVEVTASSSSIRGAVSVGDILKAIHQTLQEPLTIEEFGHLSTRNQRMAERAYQRRVLGSTSIDRRVEPVRIIDCMDAVMFGGLERPPNGRGDMWLVVFRVQ